MEYKWMEMGLDVQPIYTSFQPIDIRLYTILYIYIYLISYNIYQYFIFIHLVYPDLYVHISQRKTWMFSIYTIFGSQQYLHHPRQAAQHQGRQDHRDRGHGHRASGHEGGQRLPGERKEEAGGQRNANAVVAQGKEEVELNTYGAR